MNEKEFDNYKSEHEKIKSEVKKLFQIEWEMDWFIFSRLMTGYEIKDRVSGQIKNKISFWTYCKKMDDESSVWQLHDGTHPIYDKVNKADYKDGTYIGAIEGDGNPSRIYKLCPEKKPPPLKRIYDKKTK